MPNLRGGGDSRADGHRTSMGGTSTRPNDQLEAPHGQTGQQAATPGATPVARPIEIAPGAWHLPHYLSLAQQQALVERCRALGDGTAGFYTPTVRGGAKMRIAMLCLGRHWNPLLYRYEATRADFDGRPAPALPPEFIDLARRIASEVGMRIDPDICIMNFYTADGRLGLHQDKDESAATLAAGTPVLSVSVGDTARFLFGGTRRRDPVRMVPLASGDAFVFGGPARLCYHGVAGILPGTAPAELDLTGRFSLTFRQY